MARLRGFGMFWYDFIVGDDWKLAAGVVLGLVGTALLSHTALPSWWLLPAATVLLLSISIWSVARSARLSGRNE
jgi:hypothetical protein